MHLLRRAAATATALATLALLPATASAVPALDGEYEPSGQPTHITRGPDGNVWFVITGSAQNKELGRIAPDGTITEYDTPNDRAIVDLTAGPSTVGGGDNRIWATYDGGVIQWNPAAGSGTDHAIANLSGPRGITRDADGNLWAVAGDRLVKIAPDGNKIDDVGVNEIAGRGITLGSDGRIWVADFGNQAITAVNTAAPYAKQSFATGGGPQEIAAGPAGQLGFANPGDQVGRITTAGAVTQTTDAGTDPFGVAHGGDGAYWFAQFATDTVGRLSPAGDYARTITLPAGSGPRYIAAGANNTLWVTAETSKKIHRITGVEAAPPPPPPPPPPPGADTQAPVFGAAKVNARTRRLSLTLDEPATLRLQVDRKLRGQRVGRKCRAVRKGKRAGRKCSFWKRRRTVLGQAQAGRNSVSLGKKLAPGSYRVVVRATDEAGNTSKRTVAFKVAAAKRKRR